jgi:hypothetical protein
MLLYEESRRPGLTGGSARYVYHTPGGALSGSC